MQTICTGFYVCTWGGGRYTSVAWFRTRAEAEREAERRRRAGIWSGMPPIVEPSTERML